jgi:uncharacterized protein (DUF58 family)
MDNLQLLARIKNIPLVTSRLVEGLISGNYRSVFKGPGIEFDEVREYVEPSGRSGSLFFFFS